MVSKRLRGALLPAGAKPRQMVTQVFPLQSLEVNGGVDIHLQPMEDHTPEQVDAPEGGCDPVESPHWSRLLAGPATHGEEPTLEQVFWQDLWPSGGPTLE
ncbi:AN1-type zinc finger protein 5-like [Grus japonensis]|uniref:AN1-type zinc finger protein 5-like n=1 Tax=Grus japonensis TaxID=30415 RepID=A0ABC9YFC8_GRUJA